MSGTILGGGRGWVGSLIGLIGLLQLVSTNDYSAIAIFHSALIAANLSLFLWTHNYAQFLEGAQTLKFPCLYALLGNGFLADGLTVYSFGTDRSEDIVSICSSHVCVIRLFYAIACLLSCCLAADDILNYSVMALYFTVYRQ
jgi:hypothetical protein